MEQTINHVFRNRARTYGDRPAVEKKWSNGWQRASWHQYYTRARAVGMALRDMGIAPGDRVALLSENRLEWLYTDMGTLGIGGCLVPVYATLTADEVAYIVGHAGAKVLVVENAEQLEKAVVSLAQCPDLNRIVVMDPAPDDAGNPAVTSFADMLAAGDAAAAREPDRFEALAEAVSPADLASLIYTSGTTGVPKGVMITHGNIMAVIRMLDAVRPRYAFDTDQTVPFLPLSHVFERAAGHFYGMYVGITAAYAENINTLLQDFAEKRPTMILAVPRVCEKVYQRILAQVKAQPAWRQKLFWWGHRVGTRMSALREQKTPAPVWLRLQYRLVYRLIFKKLREALGGRVRWMTASGAPTAREIVLFFNAAGIMVVEGYGMTECFAPATMSNLADYRIGTVGRPLPGVDIRIAADGEILIKGENVFAGYWRMAEETRQAFTEDGYFRTGDIGAFDDAGFLLITDRKKNLIITSGGKNIAPQKVENIFVSDPLFAQVMVIGDRRHFLSALITINPDQSAAVAAERGIPFEEPTELLGNPAFMAVIDEHVQERNSRLPRFEAVKRYRVLPREFSQEHGELTPSLKVKRKIVLEKHAALIEEMYADTNHD